MKNCFYHKSVLRGGFIQNHQLAISNQGRLAVISGTPVPADGAGWQGKPITGGHAKCPWGVKDGKMLAKLLSEFSFAKERSLVEGMWEMHPIYRLLGKMPFTRSLSRTIIVLKRAQEKAKNTE